MKTKFLIAAAAITLSACQATNTPETAAPQGKCPVKKQEATKVCPKKDSLVFNNADFYTQDGKFNEEAAKDAVLRLLKYYDYPITDKTRSQLWVSDYGTGRFTEVGLAAIMYKNHLDGAYSFMLQDLFLLPNQMLPEHWHLAEDKENGIPAKMEGWLVRNGETYTVGEGEDNLAALGIRVPASHTGGVTVKHAKKLSSGEYNQLGKVLEHHWQIAGPKGAIITEVANAHCGSAVRHQVPAINAHFLK